MTKTSSYKHKQEMVNLIFLFAWFSTEQALLNLQKCTDGQKQDLYGDVSHVFPAVSLESSLCFCFNDHLSARS